MTVASGSVYVALAALRDAISDALAATVGGSVDVVDVVPGSIAWDSCDCGGQLSVTWTRMYLSDRFPTDLAGADVLRASPCDSAYLVVDVTAQVLRCAPSPADGQLTVSGDALDAAAQVLADDAAVTLDAAACRLAELVDTGTISDYQVRSQTAVGPQGACVGTELNLVLAVRR